MGVMGPRSLMLNVSLTLLSRLKCIKRVCYSQAFIIGIVGGGVQLGPLATAATNRPIVPASDDYDDGEIGGMMIGRGNRSTRRKPVLMPLCPPQIPLIVRTRTRAAAVGSQRLTARATARPASQALRTKHIFMFHLSNMSRLDYSP
jgi:hypothetical protein